MRPCQMESQLFVLVPILLFVSGQLFEGEVCFLDDGSQGVCCKTSSCLGIEQMISQHRQPKVCSFNQLMPIVCCATTSCTSTTAQSTKTTDTGKAFLKCQEYGRYVVWEVSAPVLMVNPERYNESKCSMVHETTVRGLLAEHQEFPHMAALGYGDENNIKWMCAGSLISERFILTAADCLFIAGSGAVRWARLGDLDLTTSKDMTEPVTVEVSAGIKHPNYVSTSLYNNIALIKLQRDVIFTPSIRPACLYTQPGDPPAGKTIATGWSKINTDFMGEVGTYHLTQVNVPLQNARFCNQTFKTLIKPRRRLRNGVTSSNMICSSGPEGQARSCGGDMGGPLQIALSIPYCMYGIIGLTSFSSSPCGWVGGPTIFTRVSSYVPWIESVVWP